MKTACLLLLVLCPLWGVCENSALSSLGERVARDGVFISRRGTGEEVPSRIGLHQHSRFSGRLPWGEGGSLPASSLADAPHRAAQGGAGRPFARRGITDAQVTQPATARRRVGGHSAAAPRKANRPEQPPNSRQRFLPGEGMKLRQPGSDSSGGAARGGLIQERTVNKAVAVRTPSVVRPAAPIVNNTRHRSPNPAVVSGSPNSHGSNTAVINGTRTSRRP
jgi:hypothetical protein